MVFWVKVPDGTNTFAFYQTISDSCRQHFVPASVPQKLTILATGDAEAAEGHTNADREFAGLNGKTVTMSGS